VELWKKLGLAVAAVLAAKAAMPKTRKLPKGKGVFIDDLAREGKSPAHLIERLKWMGISFLLIEIAWHDDKQDNTHNLEDGSLAAFVPELVAAGIQCWVWGFPSPDRVERFVELVEHAYRVAPQVAGVVVDAEKPFYGPQYATQAEDLMSRLKALGRPVGFTSYGYTNYHTSFPYEAFASADFGMPQIYSELGEAYPDKADDSYRDLGIEYIVPINGASSVHRVDDPDGFGIEEQAEFSDTSDGAIAFWNYRHLVLADDSRQAQRATFVREFSDWGGDG
jgi:hypothetical protein